MAFSPAAIRMLIVLFVSLGSLTYGYCSSIIATTLGQPTFIAYFELNTRSNAADLMGAINGLYQAGGLFGSLSIISTPDWLGRRKALLLYSVITLIGGALQAGSVHIGMFLVMRFITGFGIGALVGLVPLYQSEMCKFPATVYRATLPSPCLTVDQRLLESVDCSSECMVS